MTSSYFPPLDQCLAGDATLISWRTAYRALCDETTAVDNTHLHYFLSDQETLSLLSVALDPFVKPTSRSATEFTTKTAPIHVAQTRNVDYSLEEIKNDAQWLSREVQVEELTALRMAIVEWQERAADQLLNTAGNGSSLALSTRTDLARMDAFNFSASTARGVSRPAQDFAKEDVRRRRLLNVYLSEKSHLMKLSAHLTGRVALVKAEIQERHVGSLQEDHARRNWIDDAAATVSDTMCPSRRLIESEAFCVRCVERVDAAIASTDNSNTWPRVFTEDDEKAQTFIASQFGEIVSALTLMLSALHSLDGIPSATTVQAWFSVMEKYTFLQGDFPLLGDMSVPQALTSIISVDILKLHLVTAELMTAAGADTASLNGKFYIQSEACLTAINMTFYRAAQMDLSIAAPAIYAWSIITSIIQDIASIHKDVRERRIEQGDDEMESFVRSSRRGSVDWQSEFERLFAALKDRDMEENRENPQLYFLNSAVNRMRVFAVIAGLSNLANTFFTSTSESATGYAIKETLLDLLREGLPFVQYGGELLEAILSLLEHPTNSRIASSRHHARAMASKFLSDHDLFRPFVLDQAFARYPYELSPLLRLLTAVSSAGGQSGNATGATQAKQLLDNLQSFTQMVPDNFRSYELEHEDDNANQMQLTAAMPIFATRQALLSLNPSRRAITMGEPGNEDRDMWQIASGTSGVLVGERSPYVIKLQHQHSGLEYLGLLLSTFTASSELLPVAPGSELDRITAAENISLFTAMLEAVQEKDASSSDAKHLLGRLSNALKDGHDFVSVVAEVFETELLAHLEQVAQAGSLELVISCAEFMCVLVSISPERAWSILARSSLLGVVDGASSLAAVVGGAELQLGQYRFLAACVKLHTLLLEDSIAGLVKRKSQPTRRTHRFATHVEPAHSTSERTTSAVLNSYQKILVDALQSLPDWKFENGCERCRIITGILDGFSRLLKSTYGVDLEKDPSQRLTNVLAPAAVSLLNTCVPQAGDSPLLNTFSRVLPDALPVAGDDLPVEMRTVLIAQTNSLFTFLTVLVRAAKGGVNLVEGPNHTNGLGSAVSNIDRRDVAAKKAKTFSSSLLQSMPALASLLASDHAFKADLFPLLAELVQTVGSGDGDPPSILAQFDPEAAKSLLKVVTQLDRPLCDVAVERHVWDFLSVVMGSRQQWFAIYLLTGALPKVRGHRGDAEAIKGKPLLSYALDQLSTISTLPPHRAVGMLKFVAVAQQTWVWATNELRSHADFLKNTLAWLNSLTAAPQRPASAAALISARECEMASYLCEILAINLHASLEIGDESVLKLLIPKLDFLKKHGATVDAYNRSLHNNLADNLRTKFPQSALSDFKRTDVNPAPFGMDYYYDRELAASVLGHDACWVGEDPTRLEGYADEFSRANANLSLMHAQTALLKSWKTLATTLCDCADQDTTLQSELALIAQKCLLSNASPSIDEPGVADVLKLRAELAFVITSKLVALRCKGDSIKDLLPSAWELVRSSPVDYDVATAAEDVGYYRQLLQILYLTIQPHTYVSETTTISSQDSRVEYLPTATSSCLVAIVNHVIAPGFRALCGNLHNDIELALPADFALLTALLQAILAVPGINSVSTLLSDVIASSSIVRGALSLYSWSDQLGEDPIYGEIAITFLLSLSQIRPVAMQMALEGTLTQLSSANLSNYFRKTGGKGPFDSPPRMFSIWTGGFLPLCLNLLDTVGPPVAGEVGVFLNSFPEQLRRAEKSFSHEIPSSQGRPEVGSVTLGIAQEANLLGLIEIVLRSDFSRAAAEGIVEVGGNDMLGYDGKAVREAAEGLLRRGLAARVVPVGGREEKWSSVFGEGAGAAGAAGAAGTGESLLVRKIVRELKGLIDQVGAS